MIGYPSRLLEQKAKSTSRQCELGANNGHATTQGHDHDGNSAADVAEVKLCWNLSSACAGAEIEIGGYSMLETSRLELLCVPLHPPLFSVVTATSRLSLNI